jgi:hypothetical protein
MITTLMQLPEPPPQPTQVSQFDAQVSVQAQPVWISWVSLPPATFPSCALSK